MSGNRIKRVLNERVSVVLAGVGHSDAMIRDAKREGWWWLKARGQALARRSRLLAGSGVVWTEAGRAELLPIEVPAAGAGEVTVRILTSVVSPGSERAQFLRLPSARVQFPYRPGYAAAGVVVATGAGVSHVAPGDLVAGIGVPHASVATVPAHFVYRVPPGVPPHRAALLALGVVAAQGIRRASIAVGEPVCILGSGLVGAMAQRLALASGCGPVTVVATTRSKEEVARRGSVGRFLVTGADAEEIAALGASVVIEATGDPQALSVAVTAAGERARIVLLGSARGVTEDVPVDLLRAKRLEVIGAHSSTLVREGELASADLYGEEARRFLRSVANGGVPVDDLVEPVIDPRESGAFYRTLAQSREVVGARFDWTCLTDAERLRPARLLRVPNLSASGVEFQRRPQQPGGRRRPLVEPGDPFSGATGYLRVGLLGCGDVAVHNAAALQAAPNTDLVACFDPVSSLAEDLASRYGATATKTAEGLLEDENLDAVFLSVPHHLHAPLALQAIACGRHVIVEKPLANNLAAAAEIVAAADRAGVTLSVCFPHRYQPHVAAARQLIEGGALGRFAGSFVRFLADRPASYWLGGFSGRSMSGWRRSRDQAGGGVLITNLSHYVDLVRYLSGVEADSVLAATGEVEEPAEVEDTVSATIRYANGALGSLFGSSVIRGTTQGLLSTEIHLWGVDGYVIVERDPQVWSLRVVDGLRTSRWQRLGRFPPVDTRAVFLSRFASAVDQGLAPDVSPADALAVQAFIEAAYRSSELGCGVRPADLLEEARG